MLCLLVVSLSANACTGGTSTTATSPAIVDGSPTAPPVSPAPAACPRTLPDRLPRHAMPGVGGTMVPPSPGALVICISGARTVVDPSQIARIADHLNHLKRVRSPHIFACPLDLGPTFALFFDYSDGDRLLVTVDAGGCRFATNGRITGSADTRLLKDLHRLVA